MPKNKGKGGKNRRRGKGETVVKKELILREDGQMYAQATKMLGNGRLIAMCEDGKERLCHIRGKMRKKVWIVAGDLILVGLREYEDAKCDAIGKYNADQVRALKEGGYLPEGFKMMDMSLDEEGRDDGTVSFSDNAPSSRLLALAQSDSEDSDAESEDEMTLDDL